MKNSTVWVVDDDAGIRSYLSEFLSERGYGVCCLDSGEQVLRRLSASSPPSLMLLDLRMPRVCGLDVLAELNREGPRVPSIVISADSQTPTIVQAMRLGALDYLVKPIEERELEAAMARVFSRAESREGAAEGLFRTCNSRMLQVRAICDRAAPLNVPVLILGESGSGKEVVARYIHALYSRREPFVKVNCAALPADLLESELFGHERGAFTGAMQEKPGKFELAGRGAIMLDEIGEMSPLLQAKLLHVLQDGEYCRLGGTRALTSEARILAATHRNLDEMVATGAFRQDLYFRLNVITVEIPPLRERREDIETLCRTFVEKYRGQYSSEVKQLPRPVLDAFQQYHWPGNVRELENAVKRFLIFPDLKQILPELEEKRAKLPAAGAGINSRAAGSLKDIAANASERAERELIFRTLNEVSWNRKVAARRLGICYKSLLNKLHKWQAQDGAPSPESGSDERSTRADA